VKLGEAIRAGASLRPESHQERFCQIENRGLCSDAWGAACEAVQPAVAHFNWNLNDRFKFETAMSALRAVQQHYFEKYFKMPAICPLSQQRFIQEGARIIDRYGNKKTEWQREGNLGGVTSECDKVKHLAGFVDHAFYAHGWSREEVAEAVEWYEQSREQSVPANFQHYQVN
jgi:hypothetical protein